MKSQIEKVSLEYQNIIAENEKKTLEIEKMRLEYKMLKRLLNKDINLNENTEIDQMEI